MTTDSTTDSISADLEKHAGEYCLIYVTCGNTDEAEAIGEALVRERLAACVNILPPIRSIYWWQGQLERSAECVFTAKTQKSLLRGLISKIKEMHSYECPCIVALPIQDGNPDFLDWIKQETRPLKGEAESLTLP